MSNYTTKTAALKATTVDTRILDAKQIDTKKLFINGELFDPSQIKESPNEAIFAMLVDDTGFSLQSKKLDQSGNYQFTQVENFEKGSETEGIIPNGVYAVVQLDDNFVKCIGGNSLNDIDDTWFYNLPLAKFGIQIFKNTNSSRVEPCILENFITANASGQYIWVIKICEEDDNLSELYGGIPEEMPFFAFLVSIPYYIPENDTSSSTYSLRKTNPFDSLREKFEQMR